MDILSALASFLVPNAYASPGESYYEQGKAQTKQNEGFRSEPYNDTLGIPTIGYGFNMNAHPGMPNPMTQAQANPIFDNYYKNADATAMNFAGDKWGGLTDAQKTVLTDMAYNMHKKLYKFKNMQSNIQSGNDQGVRDEMMNSNWYNQVGDRGPRNVNMWDIRSDTPSQTLSPGSVQ